MTAEASTFEREVANFQFLADCCNEASVPDVAKLFASFYDSFINEGPNGHHLCIVFEFLGPTLAVVLRNYRELEDEGKLSANTVLKITRQLLQAVDHLHRLGYAHGGESIPFTASDAYPRVDVSDNNIAFTSKALSMLDEPELFDIIGTPSGFDNPDFADESLRPNVPSQLIKAASWDNWIDEDHEDIKLIDLGEMFPIDRYPNSLAQPTSLKAPETIFTDTVDYRIDLWRVGCVVCSCHA